MGTLQGSWIWYELMTTDALGAKAFYEAVAGWTITPGTQPPLHYGMIVRADGRQVGGMLPLTADMLAEGAHPSWVGYVGVDDLDATIAAVLAKGGKLYAPRMDIAEGSFAMVGDPWGAPFYLMAPASVGSGQPSVAFSTEDCGSVSWNELSASDPDGAQEFYGAIFGWEQTGAIDMGSYGTYRILGKDGAAFGGLMAKAEGMPGGWSYYIRVPDIDAAAHAITEQRGQVLTGPMPIPGEDWAIIGLDPQGASFALVGKRVGEPSP